MKKIVVVLMLVPVLFACNRNKIENLESRNDSLVQVATAKDQALNDFLTAFNDIQDNLDSIKEKEMMITEKTVHKTELKKNAKDQINDDINDIYRLLNETREKLNDTRSKLGGSNKQIKELEKMLSRLGEQLEERDQTIEQLRLDLESMNIKITNLSGDVKRLTDEGKQKSQTIENQKELINEKTGELNTAYYAFGSKRELRDNNIITLEGGFIGIGKAEKLTDDPNRELFIKIDIRETTSIPIPGDKAEVVTPHPPESYVIEGEGKEQVLKITDSKSFWKSSKYLVVITD
ncbi:MAG: hypothetical protein KDC05_11045 [Bacteroidales bacterium]|nr:hypothetical protein [Bacteroidales bacterium]